jgi:hypothetical protein
MFEIGVDTKKPKDEENRVTRKSSPNVIGTIESSKTPHTTSGTAQNSVKCLNPKTWEEKKTIRTM